MTETPHEHHKGLPPVDALTAYLSESDYELLSGFYEEYDSVSELVAPIANSSILAVDGPTNSGKTSLTRSLVDFYTRAGRAVSLLPIDYFLRDRDSRNRIFDMIARGEVDISQYSAFAWDHEKYHTFLASARETLLNPSGRAQTLIIPDAYDRATGKNDHAEFIPISPGGVLVTEGVGVHAFHGELLDIKIRTDVRHDSSLVERVLMREQEKSANTRLPEDYIRWRYNLVDRPHTAHLRTVTAGTADYVVDTTNFRRMAIFKKRKN